MFEREPAIAKALLTITLRRNHELLEFLDAQQRLSLPVRVARLLLTAVDVHSTTSLIVDCRQEDLAFLIGISRVSVGKALKKLRDEKLVQLEYGRVVLPDVDRLTEWVDAACSVAPVNPAS